MQTQIISSFYYIDLPWSMLPSALQMPDSGGNTETKNNLKCNLITTLAYFMTPHTHTHTYTHIYTHTHIPWTVYDCISILYLDMKDDDWCFTATSLYIVGYTGWATSKDNEVKDETPFR